MNRHYPILASIAICAASAQADWLLNEYETVEADSSGLERTYGIKTFANRSSEVSTTSGGSITLRATKIASDGIEGYTANFGWLHPLMSNWKEVDVRGMTGISLEVKLSVVPAAGLEIGLITEGMDWLTAFYIQFPERLRAGTLWLPISLDILDFLPPAEFCDPCGIDYPSLEYVLQNLKGIRFSPKVAYSAGGSISGKSCTNCVGPTQTAITMEIRKVTLLGVDKPIPVGIEGTKAQPTFEASYHSGILSLQGSVGFNSIEIMSVSGKSVAIVPPLTTTSIHLERGTYLIVAKGQGSIQTRKLAVLK